MSLRRRTLWLILSAIPTLAIAAAAGWILMQFLAARDRLGVWHVSLLEEHGGVTGAVIAQGEMNLVATGWTAEWSRTPPFVRFLPALATPTGSLHLDAPAIAQFAHLMGEPGWERQDIALINPQAETMPYYNARVDVAVELELKTMTGEIIALDLRGGGWSYFQGTRGMAIISGPDMKIVVGR